MLYQINVLMLATSRNKIHGIQMERKAPKIVSSLQMITSCLLDQILMRQPQL